MPTYVETARRVLFEDKDEDSEFPYWGRGSSFLLANSTNHYWVTAKHVIDNMQASVENLRIFPSDTSEISLPFNESYLITNNRDNNDEEFKDIYILRINLAEFDQFGDTPLASLRLEHNLMPAENLSSSDELWIIGYPSEHNSIDYDKKAIKSTRSVIRALYIGNSSIGDHCHEAKIETSIKLPSLDGLSGSPVFYNKPTTSGSTAKTHEPVLVGMLLRGSAKNSVVHFVSSNVIHRIIQLAEEGS